MAAWDGLVGTDLQQAQNQLETLVVKAERLMGEIVKVPGEEDEKGSPVDEANAPNAENELLWSSFEDRFQEMLRKFHHRMLREEALQQRCKAVFDDIGQALQSRGNSRVIQNEL